MARDVALIPLLIGLGMDELSVGATSVPRVKMAVRSLSVPECRQLVDEVLQLQTTSEILGRCLELATQRLHAVKDLMTHLRATGHEDAIAELKQGFKYMGMPDGWTFVLSSLVGVFAALLVGRATFNISSFVGAIMMVGIVSENAYFLVAAYRLALGRGATVVEAAREALVIGAT